MRIAIVNGAGVNVDRDLFRHLCTGWANEFGVEIDSMFAADVAAALPVDVEARSSTPVRNRQRLSSSQRPGSDRVGRPAYRRPAASARPRRRGEDGDPRAWRSELPLGRRAPDPAAAYPYETIAYGATRDQVAELRLPEGDGPFPVAVPATAASGVSAGSVTRLSPSQSISPAAATRRGNSNTAASGRSAVAGRRLASTSRPDSTMSPDSRTSGGSIWSVSFSSVTRQGASSPSGPLGARVRRRALASRRGSSSPLRESTTSWKLPGAVSATRPTRRRTSSATIRARTSRRRPRRSSPSASDSSLSKATPTRRTSWTSADSTPQPPAPPATRSSCSNSQAPTTST